MRRPTAAIGSAVFFLVGPGIMAGLIPWLLTGWQVREPVPYWVPMRVLGVVLLLALDLVASDHVHYYKRQERYPTATQRAWEDAN